MKVGLCTGCFDSFHEGHVFFLAQCISACDWLVVAINTDDWCRQHKGPDRPFWSLISRLDAVQRYLCRDGAAVPFNGDDALLASIVKPDVVFRGWDQRENDGTIPIERIGRGVALSTSSLAAQRRAFK